MSFVLFYDLMSFPVLRLHLVEDLSVLKCKHLEEKNLTIEESYPVAKLNTKTNFSLDEKEEMESNFERGN